MSTRTLGRRIGAPLLALVIAACGGAVATGEPSPAPSAAPTVSPEASPDVQLAIACDALEEFRALGDHVVAVSESLDEDYDTWAGRASALLTQVQKFFRASEDLDPAGRYGEWYGNALLITQELGAAVEAWDEAVAEGDLGAQETGNELMQAAADMTEDMNRAAAEWEGECEP